MYFLIILPTTCVGINRLGVRMLEYVLRFSFITLVATTIAFIFPALVLFFLQVLIIVGLFLCVLYILNFFVYRRYYKGEEDES